MLHPDGRYTPTPPPEERDFRLTPAGRKPLDMSPTRASEIVMTGCVCVCIYGLAFFVGAAIAGLFGLAFAPSSVSLHGVSLFGHGFAAGFTALTLAAFIGGWEEFRDSAFRDGK